MRSSRRRLQAAPLEPPALPVHDRVDAPCLETPVEAGRDLAAGPAVEDRELEDRQVAIEVGAVMVSPATVEKKAPKLSIQAMLLGRCPTVGEHLRERVGPGVEVEEAGAPAALVGSAA